MISKTIAIPQVLFKKPRPSPKPRYKNDIQLKTPAPLSFINIKQQSLTVYELI
jgi:hypothetical protein